MEQIATKTTEIRLAGEIRSVPLPGGAKLELAWIPPGEFMMGAPPEDSEAQEDEGPTHRVRLEGFWLGRLPVTQAQWQTVMRQNPSHFKGADRPVENVSWNNCQKFLKKAGQGLRLPTEAEWEYACRAGSTGPRYGKLDESAWYSRNSDKQTHPVGQKKPNAWGLHDMLGNVWEWCQDAYKDDPYKARQGVAESPVVNGDKKAGRVLRGGSWYVDARLVRASCRSWLRPGDRSLSEGLRVACSGSSGAWGGTNGSLLETC